MEYENAIISIKLSRLIAEQTEFLQKSEPSAVELQEFEKSIEQVRELFTEIEQFQKSA